MVIWDKKILQLNDALALLIPFPNSALAMLQSAGVNYTFIDFSGGPLTMWNSILRFVIINGQLEQLVQSLMAQFPDNPHLRAFQENKVQDYNPGPNIKSIQWRSRLDERTKEKIMGAETTLLPIKFLQQGLAASRAVVRIRIPGKEKDELGSGFLIHDNLLVTNNHVIPDVSTAAIAEVAFNYEESLTGLAVAPTLVSLVPDDYFRTSVTDDWTVVRVAGDMNTKFGKLRFFYGDSRRGDFVNIIQHPGGRYKQIALYHNIITYEDENIIQYLTDTEPGSSGAPVFNSNWEVVALHHSGGVLFEPGIPQQMLRNEGVNINKVINGIKN